MIKTIVKYVIAAVVAIGMAVSAVAVICVWWNIGYWAAPMVVFVTFGVVGMYAGEWLAERLLAAIGRRQAERDDIIKFRRSIDYRQAAVFVGTACLFLGEPKECEEICDDLCHRGVQAEVQQLSGEEVFNVI